MRFLIRIDGEQQVRPLDVQTGIYRDAVAAVPAIFGRSLPVDVEIWAPNVLPEYGPYHYRVCENKSGDLVVESVVTAPNPPGPATPSR